MPQRDDATNREAPPPHGAADLPGLHVDAYNAELREDGGFVGDRASSRAFAAILDDLRDRLRRRDDDPLGGTPSDEIDRSTLDRILRDGAPEAAALVQGAVEGFAQEMVTVIRRFLRHEGWAGTQAVVVGGGFRGSRIGELAAGRAAVTLKAEGEAIDVRPIRHAPDDAGLIGCAGLFPPELLSGRDEMLAVDIGGSKIRAGRLALHLDRDPGLAACAVAEAEIWRHKDENSGREQAVAHLAEMLAGLARRGGPRLAPFIGVGCPGLIRPDGRIVRGGQNLPGNWEEPGFNLPDRLREAIGSLAGQAPVVVLHNDAVVQGLSEAPFMREVARWGVLTVGTGLGNARFSRRGA